MFKGQTSQVSIASVSLKKIFLKINRKNKITFQLLSATSLQSHNHSLSGWGKEEESVAGITNLLNIKRHSKTETHI